MELRGAKTLVVGMKRSGIAAAQLLHQHGADVRATDLKPLADLPEAAAELGRLRVPFALQTPEVFEGFDLIVLSPDVPSDLLPLQEARLRGVRVIGEVELAAPFLKGRNVCVTGSNGKTTTTSLIGHMLEHARVPSQVGGNIGKAVCAMVETSRADGWNVLELSSFQLETIYTFRAHIALALNVTQNHLDRHHTFANYVAAKGRIFLNQTADDYAVLNADDSTSAAYASFTRAPIGWFSSRGKADAYLAGDTLMLRGDPLMSAAEVPIRGRHNAENVLAASLAARRVGIDRASLRAAILSFRAVEHRLEFVRKLNDVDFYNDSKATSVDATLKALDSFEGGLWVILGGKDKGLDYAPLREPLAAKARGVLLIGAASDKIAESLNGTQHMLKLGTLAAAVDYGFSHASPGDTVLLAPACASFDQFNSYEHRGEVFKKIVNELESKS